MGNSSRRLDELEDTPVSRRRLGRRCAWERCDRPSQGRTDLCEAHNQHAHNDFVEHAQYGRARLQLDGWCLMPGCTKLLSELPNLHLCNAHLAIVHQRVAAIDIEKYAGIDEESYNDPDPEPEPKAIPPKIGIIYYIDVASHIKIGWTSNLTKRMHSYPPNSRLLATHPGTRSEEVHLHKRFAVHRTHGREWYAPVPSVLHHIEQMKTAHGLPPVVSFGAQPVTIPEPRGKEYISTRSRSGGTYKRNAI